MIILIWQMKGEYHQDYVTHLRSAASMGVKDLAPEPRLY
jgi:hypothetical protein